jgi:hypothetical protein
MVVIEIPLFGKYPKMTKGLRNAIERTWGELIQNYNEIDIITASC